MYWRVWSRVRCADLLFYWIVLNVIWRLDQREKRRLAGTTVVIQVRDSNGLNQGSGEVWSEPRGILEELTGFTDGLGVEYK